MVSIKHRLSLEGDDDVKRRLQAVGDVGKKSLADIEGKLGAAQKRFEGLGGKSLGGLKEALAPLTEASGVGGLLGSLGAGGLFARILGGAAGPAALTAAVSALALHLAKVREETEKTEARLKELGGSKKSLEALDDSAKKLGTTRSDLAPGSEKFLVAKREAEQNSRVTHPPGYMAPANAPELPTVVGGSQKGVGTEADFNAARSTLLAGSKVDKTKTADAIKGVDAFFDSLYKNKGLTSDAVRSLSDVSRSDANRLARVVGPTVGRGFSDSAQLVDYLNKNPPIPTGQVTKALAKDEPNALKAAADARGVSDAFDGLLASTKRLDEAFGESAGKVANKALTGAVDAVSAGVDKVTGSVEHGSIHSGAKKGYELFSGVSPFPKDSVPSQALGVVGGINGAMVGAVGGALKAAGVAKYGETPNLEKFLEGSSPQQGQPGGLINNALEQPDLLGRKNPFDQKFIPPQPQQQPAETPPPFGYIPPPKDEFQYIPPPSPEEQQRLDRSRRGLSPEPPSLTPQQTQPLNVPTQVGDQGSLAQSIAQSISAAINGVVRQDDLKQTGPAAGAGIRGALEDPSGSVKDAGAQLASVIAEIAANIKNSSQGASATATLAGGGPAVRRLDDGGHISGPGTSTSDSIPAMLSDGEYVIKADSARKIGRTMLDRLNAAAGGPVDYSKFRRFAAGGLALGSGQHQVSYDPDTGGAYVDGLLRLPGDPILNDPIVRQAIERSKRDAGDDSSGKKKHKSDFTGIFGGHVFDTPGSYAKGGSVGRFIDFPGFAEGGLVGDSSGGAAPALSDAGTPGAALGHYKVDLSTNHGDFQMMADEEVARKIANVARDRANFQTGPSPSWDGGR